MKRILIFLLLALVVLCSKVLPERALPPPTSPSASCATFQLCKMDPLFLQEATNFVSFATHTYPDTNVPNPKHLLNYSCGLLNPETQDEKNRSITEHRFESHNNVVLTLNDWFRMFFHYSYWATEVGNPPYRNPLAPPFWWCFLDDESIYTAGPSVIQVGAQNIINGFSGLGFPLTAAGSGFYVDFVNVTDIYPVRATRANEFYSQSFCIKELVNIDFGLSPPGTVKPKGEYQLFATFVVKHGHQWVVKIIKETIDTLATIIWAGLCGQLCPS